MAVWEELAENRRESVELWRRLHVVENVGVEEAATAAEADAREYVPYAKTNPWGKEIEGEDEPTLVIGDGYGDRAWDACESRAKAGQWRAQFEELWWGYTINHALFNISALCETAFPDVLARIGVKDDGDDAGVPDDVKAVETAICQVYNSVKALASNVSVPWTNYLQIQPIGG